MGNTFKPRLDGFPERIKAARLRANYTQQALADAVGVHLQSVVAWEHGKSEPCLKKLVKIHNILRISYKALLGE